MSQTSSMESAVHPLCRTSASPIKTAVLFALVGRLLYSAIAALSVPYLKLDPRLVYSNEFTEHLMSPAQGWWRYALLGVWERFDTLWYLHLAQSGFDRPDAVVFYPVYPWLIALSHLPPLVASLVISTLASFLFAWGLQKLVMLDYSPAVGMRTLVLYLVWPAGFMLFAGYPESLLLCCVVWAIYFARRGCWWATAVTALLAGGTKAVGALVFLPIAFIAIRDMKWRVLASAAGALVVPIGMALWIYAHGGTSAQQAYAVYWRTAVALPWETLWRGLVSPAPFVALNMLALGLLAAFSLAMTDRLEYAVFTLGAIGLFLSKETTPVLQSTSRYVLVLFPAFIDAGRIFQSRVRFTLLAAALFLAAIKVFEVFLDWGLIV